MSTFNDDPRSEFLVRALGMGVFAGTSTLGLIQSAYALGDIPVKLPPGQSIYKLKGKVTVDGVDATLKTPIGANSLVKTGRSSRVIFGRNTPGVSSLVFECALNQLNGKTVPSSPAC